ncbi:MAG: serine--tRNA ligase [Deltaproteobacteria bacterium]|nr:serine--tRNA ligase [Deltaproteobacteria bacterium]
MLDHRAFHHEADAVLERLTSRGVAAEVITQLKTLVSNRSEAIGHLEALRHKLNEATGEVQQKAKAGDMDAVAAARASLKGLKSEIKDAEELTNQAQEQMTELLLTVPNLPHESVPVGADESHNRIEREVGEKRAFDFEPKPHWEVGEKLGILDFERAAKISGSRFVVYRGAGARLERALIQFMLDRAFHNGYEEIAPPLLVRPESMQAAGQYPKFIGESYETLDREFALIPTSEVPLVNLHREEIVEEAQLPLRYTAYTPCFRREAGAAGRDTRGILRQHQFNKVELVSYTTPEDSIEELERLTGNAEQILKELGLPYRVVTLATGDLGFAATKTYDLEVWIPSQNHYREISSCSNCGDFQARRSQIRYRPEAGGQKKKAKPKLVHTLNGSSLAVGRTLLAILENYQQADGSIEVPEALRPFFGADRIDSI